MTNSPVVFLLKEGTLTLILDSQKNLPSSWETEASMFKDQIPGLEQEVHVCSELPQGMINVKPQEAYFLNSPDQALVCRALGVLWPILNRSKSSFSGSCDLIPRLESNAEICFYGGTFKPWHKGHDACLSLCPSENIIVVLDSNPLKEHTEPLPYLKNYFEFKDILQKFGQELGKKIFTYPGFYGEAQGNPTASWLPNVQTEKKIMLIGDDNFATLNRWEEYELLLASLSVLYVVPRVLTEVDRTTKKAELLQSFPNLQIELLPDHPYMHLSSTILRQG